MIRTGSFCIENKFSITNKGIVFAGRMIEGIIEKGDHLSYELHGQEKLARIKSIEMIHSDEPGKINLGLLMQLPEEDGLAAQDFPVIALLYSNALTLSKTRDWMLKRKLDEKLRFLEIFLAEISVMNRAIGDDSDESSSKEEKLSGLKWSNELVHQLWNLHAKLKQGQEESIHSLIENLNFYSSKSKELNAWLPSCLISSLGQFYSLLDKEK